MPDPGRALTRQLSYIDAAGLLAPICGAGQQPLCDVPTRARSVSGSQVPAATPPLRSQRRSRA
eukprot:8523060-Lingulodinium_polyedra.AAC.1